MKRIEEIFSNIKKTKVFADIGCDHGYLSKKVIENNLADKVIISDISALSLKKAEILLKEYIDSKKVIPYVSNGFQNIKEKITEALIAGMGGEEIISIISINQELPEILILQPMKNSDILRKKLNQLNYRIIKDYTFFDIKYYDLIVAEKGKEILSEEEIEFGKTNLQERPFAFINKLKEELKKIEKYLDNSSLSDNSRRELEEKKSRIKKILC